MASLGVLREYAKKSIPSPSLPSSVLFAHTDKTLTIFDGYPKAQFHFLIMPRLLPEMETARFKNLRTLLRWDRNKAKETIVQLQKDSEKVIEDIEDEMVRLHGYKWKIHIGFHAVPSMDHLHMHIISSDLCSPSLKNKKHYNSFHPDLGFFIHLNDVLSWLDGDDAYYETASGFFIPAMSAEPYGHRRCPNYRSLNTNQFSNRILRAGEWEKEKARALSPTKRKRAASGGQHDEDTRGGREDDAKRKKTVDTDNQPNTPLQ
ncbi:SubName: Full=Uncharacterized protein {ECO:0000313/EMBL:CCA66944.1} [Serendipita indica DSM 11827]|nr:SubName: Full=Uncharacterized protein {ECO:0000313/EMBL:CCA66944.1} [Serendipita indica DSM 11827]